MRKKLSIVLLALFLCNLFAAAQPASLEAHDHTHDHGHAQTHGHLLFTSASAEGDLPSAADTPDTTGAARESVIIAEELTDERDAQIAVGRQIILIDAGVGGTFLAREDADPINTTMGMRLIAGDVVTTNEGGYVYIQVDVDKLFRLDPNSSVTISQASETTLLLTLTAGALYFSIPSPLGEEETLDMTAGNTTMSIRGTEGYLRFGEDGGEGSAPTVEAGLAKGKVDITVTDDEGNIQHTSIGAGEGVTVTGASTGSPQINHGSFTDPTDGLGQLHGVQGTPPSPPSTPPPQKRQSTAAGATTNCGCEIGTHEQLPCGHYSCDTSVSTHSLTCAHCGRYLCQGGTHDLCPLCRTPACVGQHGADICATNTLNQYLDEEETPPAVLCPACKDPVVNTGDHACGYCGGYSCEGVHGDGVCAFVCEVCGTEGLAHALEHMCPLCNGWTCGQYAGGAHGVGMCVHACQGCALLVIGSASGHDPCALCGTYSCVGTHGNNICGNFTCQGCNRSGFLTSTAHACDTCGGYTCQGQHGAGICGTETCPQCRTSGLASQQAHLCQVCNAYWCVSGGQTAHGLGVCAFDCPGGCGQLVAAVAAHVCVDCNGYACVGAHGEGGCVFTCPGTCGATLSSPNAHLCAHCSSGYSCDGGHGYGICPGISAWCPACQTGGTQTSYHICPYCNGRTCVGNHGEDVCIGLCAGGCMVLIVPGAHDCALCGGYTCAGSHGYGICAVACECGEITAPGAHKCPDCGSCINLDIHGSGICAEICFNCGAYVPYGLHICNMCGGLNCLGMEGAHGYGVCAEFCVRCGGYVENAYFSHTCNFCSAYRCEGGFDQHGDGICNSGTPLPTCGSCYGKVSASNSHECTLCSGFYCDPMHSICPNASTPPTPTSCLLCGSGLMTPYDHTCLACGGHICAGGHDKCDICNGRTCTGGEHGWCHRCGNALCDGNAHGYGVCGLGGDLAGFGLALFGAAMNEGLAQLPAIACPACGDTVTDVDAHLCEICGAHACASAGTHGQGVCGVDEEELKRQALTCGGCGTEMTSLQAHDCGYCGGYTCDGGRHGPGNLCNLSMTEEEMYLQTFCPACGQSVTQSHTCASCGDYTCGTMHNPNCGTDSGVYQLEEVEYVGRRILPRHPLRILG